MSEESEFNETKIKKKGYFYYDFKFKSGKIKRRKIKFDYHPKRLQGGSGGPEGIKIDKLFFEFGSKERIALLWHELYHCIFFVVKIREKSSFKKQLAKLVNWFCRDEYKKKEIKDEKSLLWIEEFEADKYSALNYSFECCLSLLRHIKRIYNREENLYNSITHPPIDERINAVLKLEAEAKKEKGK